MSNIRETIARIIVEKTLILGGNGTADAIIAALSSPDDAMVERGARGLHARNSLELSAIYISQGQAPPEYLLMQWQDLPDDTKEQIRRTARACLTEAFRAARESTPSPPAPVSEI